MNCREALFLIEGKSQDELIFSDLQSLFAHLEACPHCSEIFQQELVTQKLVENAFAFAPPSDLMEEKLDPGLIIEMARQDKVSTRQKRKPATHSRLLMVAAVCGGLLFGVALYEIVKSRLVPGSDNSLISSAPQYPDSRHSGFLNPVSGGK